MPLKERNGVRLGVTGHRTLRDEQAIARAIRGLLDLIATTLHQDGSAPLTWTIISSLAQGADQVVADAVLERPGARLEVVTPFLLDEYRKDFEGAGRERFEALLARAARVQQLDGLARDVAYLRVGECVVGACEMLVAIWNGRRAVGLGGTPEIVEWALLRERVVLWIHSERPGDPPRFVRGLRYPSGDDAEVDATAFPSNARE